MQVMLCNRDHPEYGVATLTLPIPDEDYGRYMRELDRLQIGDVTAHDCYLDQITDAPPALDMLERTMVNVDELDFLARSIERYEPDELAKFQALVSTRKDWDVQTLINLSFSCEQTTVITDFSDLEEIGKGHYLTVHGGGVPAAEYEQLNGVGIALSLIAEGEGKITPYGVLYENGMQIEPLYSGHSFPAYMDRAYLMEFELYSERDGAVTVFMPQPEKRLLRMLERAHIDPNIKIDAPAERFDFRCESVFELNRLCAVVDKLDAAQKRKLSAVILYTVPENAMEIRHLTENLELFDFVSGVQSAEEFGKYMIRESGHFEYDEELEDYYDYAGYGQRRLDQEGGEFNELGYVSYNGEPRLEELMANGSAEREQVHQKEYGMQMGGLS